MSLSLICLILLDMSPRDVCTFYSSLLKQIQLSHSLKRGQQRKEYVALVKVPIDERQVLDLGITKPRSYLTSRGQSTCS